MENQLGKERIISILVASTGKVRRMRIRTRNVLAPLALVFVCMLFALGSAFAQAPAMSPQNTTLAKPKIGIMKFEVDADLKAGLGTSLYNALSDQVVNSGKLTVVDWEQMERIQKVVAQAQPNVSPEDARKMAMHQLGIEKLYLGSLSKVGSKFNLTIKVLSLDLTIVASKRTVVVSEDELDKAIEELSPALIAAALPANEREEYSDRSKADASLQATWTRAEAGDADSMKAIAEAYDAGKGVAKSAPKALKWYRRAAEAGNAKAMFLLGCCYEYGSDALEGVAKDDAEAFKWYKKGAEAGCVSAMNALGERYFHGLGVAQDGAEAAKWFRKAAETEDADAMGNLGECYVHGLGVAQDHLEAVKWFRKAAEKDNVGRMKSLAWLLATCENPKCRDGSEAVRWAEKANTLIGIKNPEFLDTLAAAYAEAGRFDDAVKTMEKAIELGRAAKEEKSIADYQKRLELFKNRQPYHETKSKESK